ncbi:unnamed protein product [Mytilus edulis]|uniref:Uncharacterized protein n=1 Tax=Mytilus edulis TaxID=6550 RepID=A0A8S3R498_MYTED|nr:unnamed protein product [Mytilus edulis]
MNNTSDHHPIKMKILYGISNDADCKNLTKDCTNRAVKWDKVDIGPYVAITNEQSDSILNMPETLEQATSINRKNRGNAIMDLHVGDICMSGEQNVMEGFKQHFRNLATPEESTVLENRQYHQQVEYEIGLITEMVKDKNIPPATLEELQRPSNQLIKENQLISMESLSNIYCMQEKIWKCCY